MLVMGMLSEVLVPTATDAPLLSASVEPPVKVTVSLAVAVLAVTTSAQLFPAASVSDVGVLHPLLKPAAKCKVRRYSGVRIRMRSRRYSWYCRYL